MDFLISMMEEVLFRRIQKYRNLRIFPNQAGHETSETLLQRSLFGKTLEPQISSRQRVSFEVFGDEPYGFRFFLIVKFYF